jgi:predicted HicB family RNase H-like nuclease
MTPERRRRGRIPTGIPTAAFGVRIPATLYDRLYQHARSQGLSISAFIRRLVEQRVGVSVHK